MKNIFLSIIALSLFILDACQKQDLNIFQPQINKIAKDSIWIKAGILHFKSPAVAMNTTQVLSQMTRQELKNWQIQYNFVSLKDKIDEAYDALAKCSEQDFNNVLQKYSQYVKLDKDSLVIPLVHFNTYTLILNSKNQFYVGGALHSIQGNSLVVALDGKNSTLKDAIQGRKKSSDKIKIYNLISLKKDNFKKGTNYASITKYIGKRSLRLTVRVYRKIFTSSWSGSLYQTAVDISCKGFKKYFWNWHNYKTNYSLNNVRLWAAGATIELSNYDRPDIWHYTEYAPLLHPGFFATDETAPMYEKIWTFYFGNQVNDPMFDPTIFGLFVGTQIEATSRGIGNNYAIIKINY